MTINQLSIFVENRKGKLAECLKTLGDAGVDIRASSIADTKDFGILRIIASDTDKAKKALNDAGFVVAINEVLGIAVDDTPGSLARVVDALSQDDVNIEYMYAFITASKEYAYVVLRVDDNEKCNACLAKNNVRILNPEDIAAV